MIFTFVYSVVFALKTLKNKEINIINVRAWQLSLPLNPFFFLEQHS